MSDVGTLIASPTTLSFGAVATGQASTGTVTLRNGGIAPIEVTQISLTGQPFTLGVGSSFPVSIAPGTTYNLTVQFNPSAAGAATGQLMIASNSSGSSTATIALSGTGMTAPAVVNAINCSATAITGAGTDACTVTLSAAAPVEGTTVFLESSNPAVAVPATVMVPANATSAGFTASALAVGTAQAATLTATAGGVSEAVALQLNAAVPMLAMSATSVAFGSVGVNSTATQSMTLSSTGTAPVTVTSATMTGTGFSLSGVTFPLTLTPGQIATLTAQFDPSFTGTATGQLTIVSNSSTGSTETLALSGTGAPVLSTLSCTNLSITGSATDTCTITMNAAAPAGGLSVSLSSSNTAITVPTTVTVPPNSLSVSFTVNASSVTTARIATLTASEGGVTETLSLQLSAAVPTLGVSSTNLVFGNVAVNSIATQTVVLSSIGTAPVTISSAVVSGVGFTISRVAFPMTLNPGQTATLSVQFNPSTAGVTTGELTFVSNSMNGASNSSNNGTAGIALNGTGTVPQLSALACTNASVTGSATVTCTITLSAAALSGGLTVSLSSSNAAVTVPATVIVPANAITTGFAAAVSSVGSAQSAMLTANEGGNSETASLQLNAAVPTLTVATSSSPSHFGDAVTFTATISSGPSGTITFYDAGASIGTGTINGTTAIFTRSSLTAGSHAITASWPGNSGYGSATSGVIAQVVKAAVPSVIWATPSPITYGTALSGAQLDASSMIPGTFLYSPSDGTVLPAGSQTLSVSFTPTDITDYTNATQTVVLTVNPGIPMLSINSTNVAFGSVGVNTPATQSLTLSSTGTAPVTVNSAVLTGIGFTLSGPTFPATLTPGQTATLDIEFDPTAAGAATGSLTVTSTSSTNGTAIIALTGTGIAASYAVDLSWDAPTSSTDPVAGYNVYRAPSGGSTYQILNSSVDSETTYTDSTVQSGQTYDYIVESVDGSGVESVPSNIISMTIP